MRSLNLLTLSADLRVPPDDDACAHLPAALPPIGPRATDGSSVRLAGRAA